MGKDTPNTTKMTKSRLSLLLFGLCHGMLSTTEGFVNTASPRPAAAVARIGGAKTQLFPVTLPCRPVQQLSRCCNTQLHVGHTISPQGEHFDDSVPKPKQRRLQFTKVWSNFMYGVNHVDSQYLSLFWEYCIRRTALYVGPASLLLIAAHYLWPGFGSFLYSFLNQMLQFTFLISSFVGGILQLPLDALRCGWHAFPAVSMPLLDYLPSGVAIHLARMMLFLQHELRGISHSYLFASIAVMFWRPIVEELQYRFLLFRMLGVRQQQQQQLPIISDSSSSSSTRAEDVTKNKADDGSPLVQVIALESNDDSNKDNGGAKNSNVGTMADTKSLILSNRVNLSSALFATTRLGWLSALPDAVVSPSVWKIGFLQSATAPYVWTVGFIQSVMAHFSSSVLSEWAPLLRNGFLVFALQQSLSTFLIARHVYAPLYEERGVAASAGAHVAWTVGKVTLPFRLIGKLLPQSRVQSWDDK